eukprot:XP_011671685.1 PREDICTED: uncharacterized protein LOC105441850 [Strongylocentrotus purpuratus]
MADRYIISDYEKAGDKTPRIKFRTGNLTKAEASFTTSAERKVRSVVLYNAGTDTVLKLAIDGEPIYLVEAIEKAREEGGELEPKALASAAAKAAAGFAIGELVRALSGVAVPGIGGAIFAHFLGPYYAVKGDGAAVAGAGAGLWGGVSGAVMGLLVGGPVGAVIGGAAGGWAACTGAHALVRNLTSPGQKCTVCEGAGLVDDFRRCKKCNGKGYLQ